MNAELNIKALDLQAEVTAQNFGAEGEMVFFTLTTVTGNAVTVRAKRREMKTFLSDAGVWMGLALEPSVDTIPLIAAEHALRVFDGLPDNWTPSPSAVMHMHEALIAVLPALTRPSKD
ncbi:MAG TPA: hypothetical protein VN039_07825 [Nitrospira sp.]|nr:hypothetical protein [Nitrospira sp.]